MQTALRSHRMAEATMNRPVNTLKPHPTSLALYGDDSIDPAFQESIAAHGVLVPLTIKEDGMIISGHRRRKAAIACNLQAVPVVVVSFANELDERLAIIDHNRQRQKTVSQRMREAEELEAIERERAKERQREAGRTYGEKHPKQEVPPTLGEPLKGETGDKAAKAAGMKRSTYDKAKAVYEAAKAGNAKAVEMLAKVDSGDASINKAYKDIRCEERKAETVEREREAMSVAKPEASDWRVTDDQAVIPCTALVTDPPYGILDEAWEPTKIEEFTRDWLSRWNAGKADFIVSFWSQRHLWAGKTWFDESLSNYAFQQLLVWHYPNNKSPQNRMGFKQTWEPILFYRRRDSAAAVAVGGAEWGDGLNDFDCHVAAVPQSNFTDAEMKQHPAQKPVSVMRWLINALSKPGDMICDPFCGSGTTGIAAMQLHRRFHGIETSAEFRELSGRRIAAYGATRL